MHKILVITTLSIFIGLLSGSFFNSSIADSGCENFGCGYEPIKAEFRCWGIPGAENCTDGGGDCSDQNCSGGPAIPIDNI